MGEGRGQCGHGAYRLKIVQSASRVRCSPIDLQSERSTALSVLHDTLHTSCTRTIPSVYSIARISRGPITIGIGIRSPHIVIGIAFSHVPSPYDIRFRFRCRVAHMCM